MTVEKTVSNLIKNQFPDFYQSEGPLFVAFVQKYFEWLESSQVVANSTYADAKQFCKISVVSGNTTVLGVLDGGIPSTFTKCFKAGDNIAIYTKEDGSDYNIYTVNTVISDAELTLTEAPDFSLKKTRFSIVKDQKNPLKYMRDFYDDIDIDTTSEEFLVYFKEKYLKNVELRTNVNTRRLVKHALDIYRSKGTERGADLLFKMVYGVPAKFYYPGDDLFRLSDGQWFIPKYIEVALKDKNKLLVGKQIFGYTSGATAFVESVVRRTVRGRLVDLLYVSAINGNFITGEIINSSDYQLEKFERPTIIGSLTSIEIVSSESGFANGYVVDLNSISGESGKARVVNVSNTFGEVDFTLIDGGYGFSTNSEILISNSVFTVNNVVIPNTFFNGTNQYFSLFEDVIQPLANVTFANSTGTIVSGANVYTYHGNGSVKGTGTVLTANGTTTGNLIISVTSGNVDHFNDARIYTDANTVNADISTYGDITAYANVFCLYDRIVLNVTNVSNDFAVEEYVYQTNPGGEVVASAQVVEYTKTLGANAIVTVNNIYGVFRSTWNITGNNTNYTAKIDSQAISIGVKDLLNNFITSSNGYIYLSNNDVSGYLTAKSSGTGAALSIGSFGYQETVNVNSDYLIDYYNLSLTHFQLTGTADINVSSNVVIGTGTDFENEVQYTLTGNVTFTSSSPRINGNGTLFASELQVDDILNINGTQDVRVRKIVNNTFLWCNSVATSNVSGGTVTKNRYLIFTDGTAGNTEAHQVLSVTNSTVLELVTTPTFSNTAATMTYSWAFPGNTAANLTFATIADILSNTQITIGRIESLRGVNPGTDYNVAPCVEVFDPYTYPVLEQDKLYDVSQLTGSFQIDELLNQTSTGARALFVNYDGDKIYGRNLSLFTEFEVTSDANSLMIGENTGTAANVDVIELYANSRYIGYNANIQANAIIGTGVITDIQVTESGYGFRDDETITISANGITATGRAVLGTGVGTGPGFYKRKNGFLSDSSKVLDAYYYQDFSYELRSSISLSTYESMLKELIHIAGTKYYGAFVYDSIANAEIQTISTSVEQSS